MEVSGARGGADPKHPNTHAKEYERTQTKIGPADFQLFEAYRRAEATERVLAPAAALRATIAEARAAGMTDLDLYSAHTALAIAERKAMLRADLRLACQSRDAEKLHIALQMATDAALPLDDVAEAELVLAMVAGSAERRKAVAQRKAAAPTTAGCARARSRSPRR